MPEEREVSRKLRPKEHKVYLDEEEDDDDIEGAKREFSVEEKIKSSKFSDQSMLKVMKGHDVNVKYFQENGFKYPILVKQKDGLGIRVPGENFTVTDVKQCVGSRRMVDVMDVMTQKGEEMTMKEWVRYYEDKERDRLLNVISLEFSHTRLENYVGQPAVVKQLDWVDTAWPVFLKESQTETTNIIEKMKYPKVQKYVLMSVGGCYTDFHIDMGGTSVWYHILHGKKVFWVAPPTIENLDIFEKWVKSGRQGDEFLGDKLNNCMRIHLNKGNTFFIPTGWIHAVHTPVDSLVFGGNFLHSINIDMQLNVWDIESRTHVPSKFRYPFFTEIHWYVLDRYLSCVQGKSYRIKSAEELKEDREDEEYEESKAKDDPDDTTSMDYTPPRTPADEDGSNTSGARSRVATDDSTGSRPGTPDSRGSRTGRGGRGAKSRGVSQTDRDRIRPVSVKLEKLEMDKKLIASNSGERRPWVHLTRCELEGLQQIVDWCEKLPPTKKLVPKDIAEPDSLLADMRQMIKEHLADSQQESMTGDLAIKWPVRKKVKVKVRTYTTSLPRGPKPKPVKSSSASSNVIRRRRVRCKRCEPCTRSNCEMCVFCKDMKKYGGPQIMKQSCISRQCIRPELPATIICALCGGSENPPASGESVPLETLLECAICWEIVHPKCLRERNLKLPREGLLNEDLPNSWECDKCVDEGRMTQSKPRPVKGGGQTTPTQTPVTKTKSSGQPTPMSNAKTKGGGQPTPSTKMKSSVQSTSTPTSNTKTRGSGQKTTTPNNATNSSGQPTPNTKTKSGGQPTPTQTPVTKTKGGGQSTPRQTPNTKTKSPAVASRGQHVEGKTLENNVRADVKENKKHEKEEVSDVEEPIIPTLILTCESDDNEYTLPPTLPNGSSPVYSPQQNGHHTLSNRVSVKRKPRSLWDDFELPTPPSKILKVSPLKLKGNSPSLASPPQIIKADLTLEEDFTVNGSLNQKGMLGMRHLVAVRLSPLKANKSPAVVKRPARPPRAYIPQPTRSRSNTLPERLVTNITKNHKRTHSSNSTRVHIKNAVRVSNGSTRITSRGREVNLPSRFRR